MLAFEVYLCLITSPNAGKWLLLRGLSQGCGDSTVDIAENPSVLRRVRCRQASTARSRAVHRWDSHRLAQGNWVVDSKTNRKT